MTADFDNTQTSRQRLLEAGKMLYFPVVQECERGLHRWIEIPAAGKSSGDYPEPAPALKLLPKP